jgi:hypothetical protein
MAAETIPLKSLYLEDSKKVEMSGGFYLVLFDTIFFVYCLFYFQWGFIPRMGKTHH